MDLQVLIWVCDLSLGSSTQLAGDIFTNIPGSAYPTTALNNSDTQPLAVDSEVLLRRIW